MNKIRFLKILLPNGVYYHYRFLHMHFFFLNEMCYHIFFFFLYIVIAKYFRDLCM